EVVVHCLPRANSRRPSRAGHASKLGIPRTKSGTRLISAEARDVKPHQLCHRRTALKQAMARLSLVVGGIASLNRHNQLGVMYWLRQIRDCSRGLTPFAHSGFIMCSDDDRRNSYASVRKIMLKFKSVHFGHLQVDNQVIRHAVW